MLAGWAAFCDSGNHHGGCVAEANATMLRVRRYGAVAATCMTSAPDPSSSFTAEKFSREITITPSSEEISASREISDGEGSRRRHGDDSVATWKRETEVWSARGRRRTVGEGFK